MKALARSQRFAGGAFAIGVAFSLNAMAQTAPDRAPSTMLNPVQALDKATLTSFVEHPLFDPSRSLPPTAAFIEPPPIVVVQRNAILSPPPALHLTGIVEGRNNVAIVHRDGEAKTLMLVDGDRIDDWTATISPTLGITLRNGSREVSYPLFANKNAQAGVVPAR